VGSVIEEDVNIEMDSSGIVESSGLPANQEVVSLQSEDSVIRYYNQ
jgi:hypothetical protein